MLICWKSISVRHHYWTQLDVDLLNSAIEMSLTKSIPLVGFGTLEIQAHSLQWPSWTAFNLPNVQHDKHWRYWTASMLRTWVLSTLEHTKQRSMRHQVRSKPVQIVKVMAFEVFPSSNSVWSATSYLNNCASSLSCPHKLVPPLQVWEYSLLVPTDFSDEYLVRRDVAKNARTWRG